MGREAEVLLQLEKIHFVLEGLHVLLLLRRKMEELSRLLMVIISQTFSEFLCFLLFLKNECSQ